MTFKKWSCNFFLVALLFTPISAYVAVPLLIIALIFFLLSRSKISLNLFDNVQLSLIGAILLSSAFAVYKAHSLITGSFFIIYFLSYLLSKNLLVHHDLHHGMGNEKNLKKLVNLLAFCVLIISIIGILQYFTNFSLVIKGVPIVAPMRGGRIISICYNSLILASFLAFNIPIFITFFIRGYKKILLGITVTLALITFFLTVSRGPAISLIISLSFLFYLLRKKIMVVLVPAILIGVCFLFTPLRTRLMGTLNLSSDVARKVTIVPGIRMWKEHSILTGVGIHNFYMLYEKYAFPGRSKGPHYIHCMYLNFLVESGIIGFLILMSIFIILIRWSWQIYKRSNDFKKWIAAALLASFVNVFIHNLVDNTPYVMGLGILFWAGMGIISGMRDKIT
ncbi:O-antigen ligase family protein [candidate division WOR-3 bacterium]|nr:O-antigen ligase family protein [candidate division WOR-3 bacterium]